MTTTQSPAQQREAMADDLCECGHVRAQHYAPSGATIGCHDRQHPLPLDASAPGLGSRPCPCPAYARAGATGRPVTSAGAPS